MILDPGADHQIQVKQLGNSGVYVTCNCLVRAYDAAVRSPQVGSRSKLRVRRLADYASLGDFPVGAPIEDLQAAYNRHLEARP